MSQMLTGLFYLTMSSRFSWLVAHPPLCLYCIVSSDEIKKTIIMMIIRTTKCNTKMNSNSFFFFQWHVATSIQSSLSSYISGALTIKDALGITCMSLKTRTRRRAAVFFVERGKEEKKKWQDMLRGWPKAAPKSHFHLSLLDTAELTECRRQRGCCCEQQQQQQRTSGLREIVKKKNKEKAKS